jgi:CRP-like cAMP-binding protein
LPLSLVNHPHVRMAVPIIGNLAYIGIASGFLMTDMLQLRILLAFGYTGLVTFHILRPVPLRIPLRWSAVFVLVNAGAACLLIADRYMAPLSDEELQLHREYFAILTPGQFYQLLSLSTREELDDQTVLTVEGVPCPKLYFIQTGGAQVYHHKDHASNIEAGGFVNDVAFQRAQGEQNVGAYGTVVASGRCSALVWDQAKLREHLSTRPAMDRNLKYILSDHLVKSLLRQREAAHARQRRLLERRRQRDADLSSSLSSSGSSSSSSGSSSSPDEVPQNNATISRSPSQHHVSW